MNARPHSQIAGSPGPRLRHIFLAAGLLLPLPGFVSAEGDRDTLQIYIDADRTGTRASGVAIEQGIRTALSEVENRLEGREVTVVVRDHHGSSPRSKRHLQQFLEDDRALVVFCGLHSPPVLAHREFINRNHILMLDPWAAAGPITRYPSEDNWILSPINR